ncbi:GDP dissociation inhibitor [Radiomyces spectabilis]|uniref:GDP dissociation inhibitor n=1 Tax=Radiomyces spectabilis TaxID=64574 RepID=UPI002220C955|nr:GDP dissociation inhibitor [Radiomyces spectabilis]KAI8385015.1 GDP dissociation inhibitor [Radiomyces spectabilis]
MASEQPSVLDETSFDVIVLGTGLVESILAGSLARIGKTVLHLDSNPYYGGNWSVLNFRDLLSWVKDRSDCVMNEQEADNTIHYKKRYEENFRNIDFKLYEPSTDSKEDSKSLETAPSQLQEAIAALHTHLQPSTLWEEDVIKSALEREAAIITESSTTDLTKSVSKLERMLDSVKQSRSYNLDLAPKILGCRGELVEVLMRSGVGRYLEFQGVNDIFLYDAADDHFEKVPSSKEDVFTNKSIALVEKRKLMKFLTFAMNYDEQDVASLEGYETAPYERFLEEKFKITGKLQAAILYAIAIVDSKALTPQGLARTQSFMKSMGRFSKGGYLCALYGGGSEIAQAFCRVCAVYGGVYILNQPLKKMEMDNDNQCVGVTTEDGQTFHCRWLVTGIDYMPKNWLSSTEQTWVSRAFLVTDRPLAYVEEDHMEALGFGVIPPQTIAANTKPVLSLHLSNESMACPRDQYVTYLWTEDDSQVLQDIVQTLLDKHDVSPRFALFYQQRIRHCEDAQLPGNVLLCPDPTASLDFEDAMRKAMQLFTVCCPEEEFMPAQEEDPDANI